MKHDEAMRLIPWKVNGTLDEAEQRQLEEHLEFSTEGSEELADVQELRAEMQQLATRLPAPRAELLDHARQKIAAAGAASASPRDGRAKAEGADFRWAAWWQRTPPPVRWALATLLLVVAGLSAWVAHIERTETTFMTAGSDETRLDGGARAQVAFTVEAREAEIRALLLELRAEIVAGPSATGYYVITWTDSEPSQGSNELAQRLSAHPGLVDFAQPMSSSPP